MVKDERYMSSCIGVVFSHTDECDGLNTCTHSEWVWLYMISQKDIVFRWVLYVVIPALDSSSINGVSVFIGGVQRVSSPSAVHRVNPHMFNSLLPHPLGQSHLSVYFAGRFSIALSFLFSENTLLSEIK